jgi:hypothetical protein
LLRLTSTTTVSPTTPRRPVLTTTAEHLSLKGAFGGDGEILSLIRDWKGLSDGPNLPLMF